MEEKVRPLVGDFLLAESCFTTAKHKRQPFQFIQNNFLHTRRYSLLAYVNQLYPGIAWFQPKLLDHLALACKFHTFHVLFLFSHKAEATPAVMFISVKTQLQSTFWTFWMVLPTGSGYHKSVHFFITSVDSNHKIST